jgi:hypothetical protein
LETWAIEFGKKEKKENPITITIILNGKTKVKGCHATVVEENNPKRKF